MTTPNALTVDVEEYFQVEALARHVDREEWDRLESRIVYQTTALLDLFAREGVRATFFTLGWVARRHPALVRRIVGAGHELACHGDGHRMITQMSPAEFRADVRAAKVALEDIGGVRVDGYRAPTFSVVEETRWALDVLRDEGFTYDASIFPIRHDRYGIPTAPRAPHRLANGLVEFPSSTIRVAGRNLPVGGGGYLRLLPMAYTRWALDRIAAEGTPFMVYLHPWEIDAQQPRFAIGRLAAARSYHNVDQIVPRLSELMRAYAFAPAREVLRALDLLPPAADAAAVTAASRRAMSEPSFIVFGDDWGAHPSSVQHLFKRIARTHRTLWVNTLGLRPPRLDRRDAARVVRKLRAMLAPSVPTTSQPSTRDPELDLHVVAPPMLPWMRPAPLRALNRESVRYAVERLAVRLGVRDAVVVTTVPNGVDGRGLAGSRCLVYYCVDDFTNWPGVDATAAAALEAELLDACDAVLATSQNLVDTRRARHGATTLLPHGVDVAHLATASDASTPALPGVRRGRPVLGYLGLVDARLDVELVMGVARARPDWDIVFVGPTDAAPDPRLRGDNVRFVGAVPYERLPEAMASFDVALLPYVRSELTRSINPLKLREYLASGRPIVATSLPEVARYAPEVSLADTAEATVAAVAAALAGPSDRRAARAALLDGESWDDRARTFLDRCLAARDGASTRSRDTV